MIYTVTCNPSLDYIVTVKDFEPGRTNRTESERILPGGKGINVSIMLRNLGIESTALGFTAGFTGAQIQSRIEQMGIRTEFIEAAEGFSRINLKIKNMEGTEINGRGPQIGEEKFQKLMGLLRKLGSGDYLVLAGSIPSSLPDTMYRDIIRELKPRGVRVIVDAEKDLLTNVLEYQPFLIKPNNHELGEIFGTTLMTREEAVPYARELRRRGAENVLVSMAGEGAVLAAADGNVYSTPAPRGTLINGVGAGDSMVAGFLAGWMEKKDCRHAFLMGLAAGSASAFSEDLATGEKVREVYRMMQEI